MGFILEARQSWRGYSKAGYHITAKIVAMHRTEDLLLVHSTRQFDNGSEQEAGWDQVTSEQMLRWIEYFWATKVWDG